MIMAKLRGRKINRFRLLEQSFSRTMYLEDRERLKAFHFAIIESLPGTYGPEITDGATWRITLTAREVIDLHMALDHVIKSVSTEEKPE